MKKNFISLLTVCFLFCTLSATPLQAAELPTMTDAETIQAAPYASNYFTGSTGTMNTMAGTQSRIFNASSGSIPANASAADVTLNVTVSRGSIPFYIVVKNPSGFSAERYVSASGKVTFTEFRNLSAKGTWQIYIYNMGSVFTDVSTATARITVNYQY